MKTKKDTFPTKELIDQVKEFQIQNLHRPVSVVDAMDWVSHAVKNSGNPTLKVTFEWQTGSVDGVFNHKVIIEPDKRFEFEASESTVFNCKGFLGYKK